MKSNQKSIYIFYILILLSLFVNIYHYDEAGYFKVINTYDKNYFYYYNGEIEGIQNFYKYLLYIISSKPLGLFQPLGILDFALSECSKKSSNLIILSRSISFSSSLSSFSIK